MENGKDDSSSEAHLRSLKPVEAFIWNKELSNLLSIYLNSISRDPVSLIVDQSEITPIDRIYVQGADDKLGQIIWKHSNQ